jgi:hypothetical protein
MGQVSWDGAQRREPRAEEGRALAEHSAQMEPANSAQQN